MDILIKMENTSINAASFYYSINMVRLIYHAGLLREDEAMAVIRSLEEEYDMIFCPENI